MDLGRFGEVLAPRFRLSGSVRAPDLLSHPFQNLAGAPEKAAHVRPHELGLKLVV